MRVHFIGIGGIGVSALARYYLSQGHQVSGSDLAESEITKALEKLGARVRIGKHNPQCLTPEVKQLPDLVIYSPAVQPNNPELKAAKEWRIKRQSYPEALGKLTKQYFTIAVCGTHGKGTTTAMISLILIKAGLDPTVIIGTKLKEFGDSNFRLGKKFGYKILNTKYKILVIEADEYASSFLNYWPQIIVLTTIDKDHLDYFKTLGNIIKTFRKFVGHLPKHGWLVTNINEKTIFFTAVKNTVLFDRKLKEAEKLRKILKIPGEHIVADALAALSVARILKIPDKTSFQALSEYRGAWRRFEERTIKLKTINYKLISDYAHHPKEIEVTLKAVREKYPKKKIFCVFQPHQYQRTYYLFKDFVKVLAAAPINKLILAPIYSVAGRESQAIKKKVDSQKLAVAVQQILDTKYDIRNTKIFYIPTARKIVTYLKKNLTGNEVLVIMGAGDIYNLSLLLTGKTEKKKMKLHAQARGIFSATGFLPRLRVERNPAPSR
ncbi:MAG: Mur ligase domain-containing protein [bacterium]|nr:Mur ligase domain-containing protein [bacterium]